MTNNVDPAALTVAHLAVEDHLVELRDARIAAMGPANGFVIRERDASPSGVMRLGTRAGLEIAIEAYLKYAALKAIKPGLDAAVDQREAVSGDPSQGPYPATSEEVADEVVAWIRHFEAVALDLGSLVCERLQPVVENEGPDS